MSHALLDQRSLEFDREIARRLRRDPGLIDLARQNLMRWLARPNLAPSLERCYREWLAIIDESPIDDIIQLLEDDGDNAQRLRQNSPFVGILSPEEVVMIKSYFRHATQ